MRKIIIAVFIIVVLLLAGLMIFFVVLDFSASDSTRLNYMYELTMSTEKPMTNATILIPVPGYYDKQRGANITIINTSNLNFNNFDTVNISCTIENINGIPMMKISANQILPLYKNYIEPVMIMPGQDEKNLPQPTHVYSHSYSEETPEIIQMTLNLYSETDHIIDTKNPFDKEPLFIPYRIIEKVNSTSELFYRDFYISSRSDAYLVEIPVYLSYDTPDDNTLCISTKMTGINEWWVFGWQRNQYSERFNAEITGKNDGWNMYEGILLTGDGVYPVLPVLHPPSH
jgi:hypothetical protein